MLATSKPPRFHNPLIPELRMEGYTLEEIGTKCDLTKEGVRQALLRHYPHAAIPDNLVTFNVVVKELGTSYETLRDRACKMGIRPVKVGGRNLWDKEKLRLTIPECWICGEPVPKGRSALCSSECGRESWKPKRRADRRRKKLTELFKDKEVVEMLKIIEAWITKGRQIIGYIPVIHPREQKKGKV